MTAAPMIFDADRHVMEPFEMWSSYLDPSMRDEAPTLKPDRGDGPPGETLAARMARLGPAGMMPLMPIPCWRGEPIWTPMPEGVRVAASRASWPRLNAMSEASSGPGQLASMDRQGITAAALMPGYAIYLVGHDAMPPPIAHAFAIAYNRWLADLCTADPTRLVPVGLLARHDPERLVADLDDVLARGWRAVVLRPEPVLGRTLGDPEMFRFWARCAEAGVTVAIHGATRARLDAAGARRFTSQFGLHACAHGLEAMMALTSLVDGGILSRHPSLRVVLLEAGSSWLPHWLWRLNEAWSVSSDDLRRRVPENPSIAIQRSCTLGFEPGEPLLAEAIDAVGADRFVFGTDFPHYDHRGDLLDEAAGLVDRIGPTAFEQVMGRNAADLFGSALPAQKQAQEKGSASPVSQ